jgi:hypothetical protein
MCGPLTSNNAAQIALEFAPRELAELIAALVVAATAAPGAARENDWYELETRLTQVLYAWREKCRV